MPKHDLPRRIDLDSSIIITTGGVVVTPSIVGGYLLADGSVPLTGDLTVAAGIEIDGVDLSELALDVEELLGANTMPTTGYTVVGHGTSLADSLPDWATTIAVWDEIFTVDEQIVVSNTSGQIERMRIASASTPTTNIDNLPCYAYDVTRRIATDPGALTIGWAKGTLVTGLNFTGFIVLDSRGGSSSAPAIGIYRWTDSPPTTLEQIFRAGDLGGGGFGFAAGSLTSGTRYLTFNAVTDALLIYNADIEIYDQDGDPVFRAGSLEGIQGLEAGDYGFAAGRLDSTSGSLMLYNAGAYNLLLRNTNIEIYGETGERAFLLVGTLALGLDLGYTVIGPESGGHVIVNPTEGRVGIWNGSTEVVYFDTEDGNRITGLLSVGHPTGPQIHIGQIEKDSIIVARNVLDVAQFVVRARDAEGEVYVFAGNPKPQGHWMEFDEEFTVDGVIRARGGEFLGPISFASTGEVLVQDPDDTRGYAHLTPRYLAGYSVTSNVQYLSTLIAWAPTTLEWQPGSGQQRTWVAGEGFFGDWANRHFRWERGANGRVGLFNGDTPKAYLSAAGDAVVEGSLIWAGGKGVADATGIRHTESDTVFWEVKPNNDVFMLLQSTGSENYNTLRVVEDTGIAGYFSGGSVGLYARSTTGQTGLWGFSTAGKAVYGLTDSGDAGYFLATSGGRGVVAITNAASLAAVLGRNTGGGPSFVAEQGYAHFYDGLIVNENGGSGTDADFRVEGDTATHLIFADASADAVGLGTSAPSTRLHVQQTSGDAGVRNIVTVGHNSSGTPAAGFGAALLFTLESDSTENQNAGIVEAAWTTATHASRAGRVSLCAYDVSTKREGLRVGVASSAPQVQIGTPDTNYVQIAGSGALTLVGTAKYERHIQIDAKADGTVANQPSQIDFFTAGGLQYPTTGAKYAYCQWEVPDDWDGTDVYFEIDWFPDSGAISGTSAVRWTVEYRAIAEGELINNGTSVTLDNGAGGDTGDYSQYQVKHTRVTLAYNDANQPLTAQDHVFFKISRDTAVANDFSGSVTVTAYEIIYTSKGFPTSN